MSKHRRTCKIGVKNPNCKLYQEMKRIGEDAFKIELIENYSCTCIDELLRREGYWIRELNATLNMRIAGRKKQEYYTEHIEEIKEYKQKYRIDHEDMIKATNKRYYQQNREVILEKMKDYATKHAERRALYLKEYRVRNKEQLAYRDVCQACPLCEGSFTLRNKARHERTKKHLQALEQQST